MRNSAVNGPWRLLWRFSRERWWLAVLGAALGCVEMVPTAVLPLILGNAIDNGITNGNLGALGGQLGLLLVLGLAMALGAALGNYLSSLLWLHTVTTAEWIVHEHCAWVGGALSNKVRAGEVATVGTTDVFSIGAPIEGSARLIGAVTSFVVVAVLQFERSPVLTTVVLIGVPLAVLGIGPLVRPLIKREEKQREHVGDAASMAADIVAGLRILRGLGGERVFGERFAATSQRVRAAGVAAGRLESWLSAAETFLPGLVTVVITWLGARLVLGGELSIGELFSFYAVAAYLVVPVSVTTETIGQLTSALVAARRMGRVLDVQPEPAKPANTVALPAGALELVDEPTGVVLRAGKLTVVDTGSAASRIGERVAGGYANGAGTVSANGVELAAADPEAVRARILVTSNDDMLFSGPVLAEITGGGGVETPAAVHAAQAKDVLDQVSGGVLDERGRALSGGQRQRLMLARALCADAEVLVMDEPTSAVDAHTEARIAAEVALLRKGKTTVVLTQSPLWTQVADVVAGQGKELVR